MIVNLLRYTAVITSLCASLVACATQQNQSATSTAASPPAAAAEPAPTVTSEFSARASAIPGQCGGIERWPVKVGTDPQASHIDTSHPIETTIVKLNTLEPHRDVVEDNDEFSRMPEEMTVYKISGFLSFFRKESGSHGDQDYHLVIADRTGRFSRGRQKPTGHSIVVEIPDPDCYTGRHGDYPADSAFDAEMKQVRQEFERGISGVDGSDIPPFSIPVTVTGVTFFDFDHGQTGRAKNIIELHPVLDIEFTGTPPIS